MVALRGPPRGIVPAGTLSVQIQGLRSQCRKLRLGRNDSQVNHDISGPRRPGSITASFILDAPCPQDQISSNSKARDRISQVECLSRSLGWQDI